MLKSRCAGRIGVLLFFALFGVSFKADAAEGKIAYVDLSQTFDKYEKTKMYDESLADLQSEKEKELEGLAKEIKSLEDKMSLLSEKAKTQKQEELDEKNKKIRQMSQQVALDLRKERDEKLKEILEDIEKTVQSFAREKGYDFVLNDRVLLYGDSKADVTSQIVSALNKDYKAPKKK
jgi:outer membrane protein